jgi:VanZ family protein
MIDPQALLSRYRKPLLVMLVVVWAAALTLTHLPPRDVPDLGVSDKTEHVVGFAGLGGMFIVTMTAMGLPFRKRILATLVVLPLYAAIDEWTQPWFGRSCDIHDWLADCCGTAAAIVTWELIHALWSRNR